VKLCVATDLSPSGTAAVERALAMAKALGAEVLLLHVVHDPELAPAFSDDVPGSVEDARNELEAIAKDAAVPCAVDVRTAEHVADAIVDASKGCDYLFVSSQGKSTFERFRVGSIATAVMRKSEAPVVCCPHVEQAAR